MQKWTIATWKIRCIMSSAVTKIAGGKVCLTSASHLSTEASCYARNVTKSLNRCGLLDSSPPKECGGINKSAM